MSDALVGEVMVSTQALAVDYWRGQPHLTYPVHAVDLPNGGRIEGMGREDALTIARTLGTRAYRAVAAVITGGPEAGLVVMSPLQELRA